MNNEIIENIENASPVREGKVNIENVTLHLLVDRNSDAELPLKYKQSFSHSYYKLYAVTKGEVQLFLDDTMFVLKETDVAIVAPGIRHIAYSMDEAACYYGIGLKIDPNHLRDCMDYEARLRKLLNVEYLRFEQNYALADCVRKCSDALLLGRDYVVGVVIHELLAELLKEQEMQQLEECKSDMGRIHKINMLIHSCYERDISLQELADLLFLSPRQTNRFIHLHFGGTWRELVVKRRMEVALWNVANRDFSVAEIAAMVGYDSERGFFAAFKKYYGKTPGYFRNQHDLAEAILTNKEYSIE